MLVYGLSCSVFSSLSLSLLYFPRWLCLVAGAGVHALLLVVLLALTLRPNTPALLGPLLLVSALWGLGSALNKTGVSSKTAAAALSTGHRRGLTRACVCVCVCVSGPRYAVR